MFRSRWSRALALLVLLFGTLYVVASLYLPSSRRLVFGVDKRTGKVRVVESHITFLPPNQFYRLQFDRRDGWAQRDLLRLSHPKAADEQHQALYHWIVKGWDWVGDEPHPDPALRLIWAFERIQRAQSVAEAVQLIREHRLPREAVPTQFLSAQEVWEALLETDMPMTALIRNLATLTRVGLLVPGSDALVHVLAKLGDAQRLRAARIHPIAVLAALKTYAQGKGERGKATWTPVPQVVDALDAAFYASFQNVEPAPWAWARLPVCRV